MANHAAATAAGAGEDGVVHALFVELLKQHVAGPANGGHRFHLRGFGAVVAVTGSASGGGKIAAFGEPFPVDAGFVFLELVGGDLVRRHLLRVGMAVRAGLGDAQRMDRRRRILDGADVVHAVAIDAGGDGGVAGGETFSVDAGLVELELVHAFARGVLAHIVRAAVAGGAELRNGGARGLSLEALLLIHGDIGIVAGRVATVAIGATEAVGDVYVVLDEGGGALGGVIDRGVAGHAGIRGGGAAWDYPHGEPQKEENNRRSHLKYPSNVKTTR